MRNEDSTEQELSRFRDSNRSKNKWNQIVETIVSIDIFDMLKNRVFVV
jgi:hypothetical protein